MQEAIQSVTNTETISSVEEQAPAKSNKLANFWLGLNFLVIVLTAICTLVLVAWPVVAKFAAGLH